MAQGEELADLLVVRFAEHGLQPVKGLVHPRQGRLSFHRRNVGLDPVAEGHQPDIVSLLHRHVAQQQRGIDGVIETRKLVDLRDHQPAAVQHHEDVLAPLRLEVPRHEPAVPGSGLPGGVGRIVAGDIFAQALEHASPAAEPGRRQPYLASCDAAWRQARSGPGWRRWDKPSPRQRALTRFWRINSPNCTRQRTKMSPNSYDPAPRRPHPVAQSRPWPGKNRRRTRGLSRSSDSGTSSVTSKRTPCRTRLRISQPTRLMAPSERWSGSRRSMQIAAGRPKPARSAAATRNNAAS